MTTRALATATAAAAMLATPPPPATAAPNPAKATSPWHRYKVPMPASIEANLTSIVATGRDSAWAGGSASGPRDVWATADCGLLHWDGRRWANFPHAPIPGAQESYVSQVTTIGSKDAWLVGRYHTSPQDPGHAFLQRWDGRRWKAAPPPPELGAGIRLDARGPHDLWAAGSEYVDDQHPDRLHLLHWNGRPWKRLPAPPTDQWSKFVESVEILGTSDVWIAGWSKTKPDHDQIRRPMLLYWNGRKWTTTSTPPGRGEVFGLARYGRKLLAVGDDFSPSAPSYGMYALRWTGRRWVSATVPDSRPGAALSAVAAVPGGGFWVVGGVGVHPDLRPFIARCD